MNLYITAAGRYAGTQKDAGKGHRAIEVPTDKAGLLHFLNEEVPGPAMPMSCDCSAEAPVSPAESLGDDPVPLEQDGLPVAYTAFTQAQVDGMFTATPAPLRELLHRISKLSLGDLGYVAFEVGHRFSKAGVKA